MASNTFSLESANGVILSGLFIQTQHVDARTLNGTEIPERDYIYISTGVNQYRVNVSNNLELLNAVSGPEIFMGIHIAVAVDISLYNGQIYFIRPRLIELGGKIYAPYTGENPF